MKRRPADPIYLELSREVSRAGYFEPARWGYVWRTLLLVALFTCAYVTLLYVRFIPLVFLTLVLLAQVTTQLAYISHDAGHNAITRDRRWILFLGHFGMTLLTGFSFSWWMHSHGNHHDRLNERDHDLAMKYSTVLAVHDEGMLAKRGFRRWLGRHQARYIWLLLPFYHFAMMYDGFVWILRNPRQTRIDQLVLPGYFLLYFVLPVPWIGVKLALVHWLVDSMIASVYIALTFIVHHVGKKVVRPEDEPSMTLFLQQLDTTRTLHTWRIFDWYYSGLNYHIEHHLFPWVPHWRYREMRLLVQDFCRRKGFTYREEGFWEAIFNVHRHLARVARLTETAPAAAAAPCPTGTRYGDRSWSGSR